MSKTDTVYGLLIVICKCDLIPAHWVEDTTPYEDEIIGDYLYRIRERGRRTHDDFDKHRKYLHILELLEIVEEQWTIMWDWNNFVNAHGEYDE